MRRIDMESCKIEHWASQSEHKDKSLSYKNMMAACNGNEGTQEICCDTKKANRPLKYNPSDSADSERLQIKYFRDGQISSSDSEFKKQLDEVLNLNCSRLKENRKSVYKAIGLFLNSVKGKVPRGILEKKIKKWRSRDEDNHLMEYCGVTIYVLEKKLKRA